MPKDKDEKLKELFEMDNLAEDGVFCTEPSEADLRAFAEHARKRLAEKNK